MTTSIIFIVFYFGSFPLYFQRFLQSCAANPCVNWRIYTDNLTEYIWPDNVHRIEMSFQECRELFQSRFDFPISLDEPAKLCDYKPAYGYILEESLADYDFWGHCDVDQIFGDLSLCLADEVLADYDKVSAKYSCGFPDSQVSFIIVVDRYLDYFTTIMEDRLWQVLAKPVFRWQNKFGLSMNAVRAA